jgi:hypothetical protein
VSDLHLPERLRAEVGASPAVVRPLAPPWRRSLLLAPVAILLMIAVPRVWSLRWDAARVGPLRLWLGSTVQIALALVLISAALRETMPGRLSAPRGLLARVSLGLGFMAALTLATFVASPTHVPAHLETHYFRTCLTRSFGLGLSTLAVVALLLRQGLASRPATTGALAGLGAGLLADASWRLFCEVSDPAHVFTAHAGAVLGVALVGAAFGGLAARLRGSWRSP